MRRKTQITLEMEEIIFLKIRKILTGFCRGCETTAELLTIETAVPLLGLSEEQIFRLIEAGEIHFIEAEKGYVCRNSIERYAGILRINHK